MEQHEQVDELADSQEPSQQHRFELALAQSDLRAAYEMAELVDSKEMWKQFGHAAIGKLEQLASKPSPPPHPESIYTPEELGQKLGLSDKVVEWLKCQPQDEDLSVLVLRYEEAFQKLPGAFADNVALVVNALTSSGAQQIDENVFKFVDLNAIFGDGRTQVRGKVRWVIFNEAKIDIGYKQNGQMVNLPHEKTIHTEVITWVPDPGYEGMLMTMSFPFFGI